MTIRCKDCIIKCLKNKIFLIKSMFKNLDLKFQSDWFLIRERMWCHLVGTVSYQSVCLWRGNTALHTTIPPMELSTHTQPPCLRNMLFRPCCSLFFKRSSSDVDKSLVFIYRNSSVIIADIELPVDRGLSPMIGDNPRWSGMIPDEQRESIGEGSLHV